MGYRSMLLVNDAVYLDLFNYHLPIQRTVNRYLKDAYTSSPRLESEPSYSFVRRQQLIALRQVLRRKKLTSGSASN